MSTHAFAAPARAGSLQVSRFSRMVAGAVLFTGVLAASAPASADFLRQDAFRAGSANVSVTAPTAQANVGGFRGVFGPSATVNSPLLSYCIELVQTFVFGSEYNNYTMVPVASAPNSMVGGMGTTRATALARMFGDGRFMQSFDNRVNTVAMQLAVWEVVYEASANAYSVVGGDFRITSINGESTTTADAIRAKAAEYLSFTGTGTMAQIAALTSQAGSTTLGQQDFITVVPVPPSAALLGTGLLFGLWTMRRRRVQA